MRRWRMLRRMHPQILQEEALSAWAQACHDFQNVQLYIQSPRKLDAAYAPITIV